MKLLYNLAKNNDYNTFKNALMDEVGIGKWLQIKSVLSATETGKYNRVLRLCADVYASYSVYDVTFEMLKVPNKKGYIVEARQMAMYLLKRYTTLGWSEIGRDIFFKDHATVMHAHKTIKFRIDTDQLLIPMDVFEQLKKDALNILDNES